jgi:hypothetical protein
LVTPFTAFKTVETNCLFTYAISPVPTFTATVDSVALTLTVASTNVLDITNNSLNLVATLTSYPTVTYSVPFIVNFADCIVTLISITTLMVTTVTYVVGDIELPINFAVYTYTPNCNCGTTWTYTINGES